MLRVRDTLGFDLLEGPRIERFILDVEAGEFAAGGGEGGEIGAKGMRGNSRLRLAA
jgi:hypothetical protein